MPMSERDGEHAPRMRAREPRDALQRPRAGTARAAPRPVSGFTQVSSVGTSTSEIDEVDHDPDGGSDAEGS